MEERKKIRGSATAEGKEDGQGKAGEEKARFTKGQFLESRRFMGRRDIINALLEDGKEYTVSTIEEEIRNYMKGKVR